MDHTHHQPATTTIIIIIINQGRGEGSVTTGKVVARRLAVGRVERDSMGAIEVFHTPHSTSK
jgi:hypothetical protein